MQVSLQAEKQPKGLKVSFRDSKKVYRPRQGWHQTYAELAAYAKEHGHCNPTRDGNDDFLAQWMEKQRRKRDRLSSEKIRLLDAIGFNWKSRAEREDEEWDRHFEQLKEFKRQHGHTEVPSKDVKLKQLGSWSMTQRVKHIKGQLRHDRHEKLDAIGFDFRPEGNRQARHGINQDAMWREMFNRLVDFKAENGHCLVPRSFEHDNKEVTSRKPSLAGWVANQRQAFRRGDIRPDRRKLLDEIGFVWKVDLYNADASLHQKHFDEMVERLLQFKKEHGHTQVPFRYEKDNALTQWVHVQRQYLQKGELKAARKKRLDEIGFSWGKE